MIKKILSIGLLLVMILSFAGCGKGELKVGTFEGLSYETERQICEAYNEWRHADDIIKDVKILHYWGNYSGYPAVEMRGGWGLGFFIFEGIYFRSSTIFEVLIFKDNKFVDFIDAYNDGILTREDLRCLQLESDTGG